MGAGDGLVEIQPEELRFAYWPWKNTTDRCMDYKWLEFKASTLNIGAVKEEPIHEKPMSKETDISSDQALSGLADYNSTHVAKDIDEFKLKLNNLEVKLNEAEKTITNLRGENSAAKLLRDKFLHEIAVVRRKRASRVEVGFSFLSVVCVALVGTSLGYLSCSLDPSGNSSMD